MAITKIEVPELFDFGSDNSAFKLPTGTTAERPTSPSNGEMRFNTTTGYVEYYDTTDAQWWEIDYAPGFASKNFNTVLYTGNGSTQAVTGTGFTPDLIWTKNRSSTQNNYLFDSVRGDLKAIYSDLTDAQFSSSNYISFDSDGFTTGSTQNQNNNNYVAWCWKAGGAAVSNTDGTITSQVSANTAAGFSIISYTGASGTVGHGLDSTPEIIIQKKTSGAEDWYVYFPPGVIDATTNYYYMVLNTSSTAIGTTGSTAPTTTTFNPVSTSGNYIAYAFHSIAGYSKIGTYTGTSVANHSIVTGFKPAWVMIKNTNSGYSWIITDDKRTTDKILYANLSEYENTTSNGITSFDSNGFTLGTAVSFNNNTQVYVYMAFAADPT